VSKTKTKEKPAEAGPPPQVAFSVGAKSITVMQAGEVHMLDDTDARFSKIKVLLEETPPKLEQALKMMDIQKVIQEVTAGRVKITPEGVTFGGQPVGGYMAERLAAMAGAGINVTPWMLFMDNLQENPQNDIRDDVFKWMEAGKMPISEDGCIIAFKKVRRDYKDVHSGKLDYSVGQVVQMSREQCDTNRHQTCSTGLHFCSADYLRNFGGERVMIVKIDPRDVTAIPSDYNNSKGRCCRLEVTGELSSQSAARHKVFDEPVMPVDPQEIPDLMAKKPSEARSSSPGPESPIGTKSSSRRVAGNASQGKRLPTPAKSAVASKTKTPSKAKAPAKAKSAKKADAGVVAKVTKAATKAVKKTTKKVAEAVQAVEEAVGIAPTTTGRTKAKAPAKSQAPKTSKVAGKSATTKTKAPAKTKVTPAKAPAKANATKAKKPAATKTVAAKAPAKKPAAKKLAAKKK
jgi:hypothetical protein